MPFTQDKEQWTPEQHQWAVQVFREGAAEDWVNQEPPRAEITPEATNRLTSLLGLEIHNLDMRAVAIAEATRQQKLWNLLQVEKKLSESEARYRARMGSVAIGIVDAIIPPEDTRDRVAIYDAVLEALRPIDENLKNGLMNVVRRGR